MNILMNTFFLLALFLGLSSMQPTMTYANSDKCTVPSNYKLDVDAIRADKGGDDIFMQCDTVSGDHYMVRTDLRHDKCVTIISYHDNELSDIQFYEWSSSYCIAFRKKGVDLVMLYLEKIQKPVKDRTEVEK
jgi:hypothetical protein